jgi:hypothetical protein
VGKGVSREVQDLRFDGDFFYAVAGGFATNNQEGAGVQTSDFVGLIQRPRKSLGARLRGRIANEDCQGAARDSLGPSKGA